MIPSTGQTQALTANALRRFSAARRSGIQLTYQRRGRQHAITHYEITVENPCHVCRGVTRVEPDAKALAATNLIALADDGQTLALRAELGWTMMMCR